MSAADCKYKRFMRRGEKQCSRAAKVDGYCTQHHPDAVKARREASSERFLREMNARLAQSAKAGRAADALEALAVVAPLLALCARADMVTAWDANGDDIETRLNDQQRAALATLARIASEGK